jgi:hypothetical protein
MGRLLRHAPPRTRGAKAAFFATEGQQPLVRTGVTAQADIYLCLVRQGGLGHFGWRAEPFPLPDQGILVRYIPRRKGARMCMRRDGQ